MQLQMSTPAQNLAFHQMSVPEICPSDKLYNFIYLTLDDLKPSNGTSDYDHVSFQSVQELLRGGDYTRSGFLYNRLIHRRGPIGPFLTKALPFWPQADSFQPSAQ